MTGNKRVKEFKYPGTTITEDNDITTEIKQRMNMANKTTYGLKKRAKLTEFERPD